ncbi:hypothetical protein EJ04DRAFT_53349 [Polyplosphaeria fusca]|uniref:Uncharacterized protein n=1 Tax=Polyplosphaeria fusca TaxID=682080 RepID=A0A9P4R3H9_9PLEO|nr:hypothetical protein EJ04DRAFT_53349 [Polyplosphaeria fusca]
MERAAQCTQSHIATQTGGSRRPHWKIASLAPCPRRHKQPATGKDGRTHTRSSQLTVPATRPQGSPEGSLVSLSTSACVRQMRQSIAMLMPRRLPCGLQVNEGRRQRRKTKQSSAVGNELALFRQARTRFASRGAAWPSRHHIFQSGAVQRTVETWIDC